ncbi:hypothetical protein FDECE_11566 [Fusarium decemcellulare]|nr:hypothetical protein FDECE_11566 [Fusarium decemcellulare]
MKRDTEEPCDMEQPSTSSRGNDSSVDAAEAISIKLEIAESALTSLEEPKYLLVDDNRVYQKLIGKYFDKLELKYQTAWNGQEAVDIYQANPERCRLILLDISMPVMDGMRAAWYIRQYEKEKGLSPAIIVGLLARGVEEERRRMVDTFGMDTTLEKPFSVYALKDLINTWPV